MNVKLGKFITIFFNYVDKVILIASLLRFRLDRTSDLKLLETVITIVILPGGYGRSLFLLNALVFVRFVVHI